MKTEVDWSKWFPPFITYDASTYDGETDKKTAANAVVGQIYASRWGNYDKARVWECRETGDFCLAGCFEGIEMDRWPMPPKRGRYMYTGAVLIRPAGGVLISPDLLYKVTTTPTIAAHPVRCTTPRCPTCRPTPPPFITSISEWDLLPDA
jgi:hypothetical protein